MLRKLGKVVLVVFLLLTCVAFTAPFFLKGKVLQLAKEAINKNLNAETDFADLNLSFFRQFPRVSISLENLFVRGTGVFKKDTLFRADKVDIAVNLLSIFGSDGTRIHAITLEHPDILAIINEDGKANWDIMKEDSSSQPEKSPSSGFRIELQRYAIVDGRIRYRDIPGNMYFDIQGLNHSGKGDFTQDLFTLSTKTSAEKIDFSYSGVSWLSGISANMDADLSIDNKSNTYKFDKTRLQLNQLKVNSNGFFQLVNDSTYKMDINFDAPSTDFKEFLSMVPAIYQKDFEKIESGGTALFNGFVRGTYGDGNMPGYDLNVEIKDGFFKYPDLPKSIKQINLLTHISNPDGIMDHLKIEMSKAHFEMDQDPFDMKFVFERPETDMHLDLAAKGKINLAEIKQYIKLEDGTDLSGRLNMDLLAKGDLAVIQKKQPGEFSASGLLDISELNYRSRDLPQPVKNGNLTVRIENQNGQPDETVLTIPKAHLEIGDNPLDFGIEIEHPISDLHFDGWAKGKFDLSNTGQFTTLPQGTSLSGILDGELAFKGTRSQVEKKAYDKLFLAGKLILDQLKYHSTDYPEILSIEHASMQFDPNQVKLAEMNGNYAGTGFRSNGQLDNVLNYMLNNQPLKGHLNLSASEVDLNRWMGTSSTTTETTNSSEAQPFLVPANLDLGIDASVAKLTYDKVDYENVKGSLNLKDETVWLKNVTMQALEGSMAMEGYYSTRMDHDHPDIYFTYEVKDLDVQKAFYAFNTVKKLMPIGQFLSGRFSSQMKMNGKLGMDMMPVLNSLSGDGNLLVLNGVLKNFGPLEKIAGYLGIDELKEITIKDIRNQIAFTNGKVLVKPFHIKVKDIDMEIGGMHGFDQSIDYLVQMKVPRKYLGEKANSLVNQLTEQANQKGIPVKMSEDVNLSIRMGGTLAQPEMKTQLKEAAADMGTELKQQAFSLAKEKADSTKTALKDTLNQVKNKAATDLKESLVKQLSGTKDSSGAAKSSLTDDIKNNSGETLKNTLNDLNPFKKKKKSKDTNGSN